MNNINEIKRIKIENIKGKKEFDLKFTDFVANQPNIIVAPNGYGKSTIAAAFKAASSGRLKINSHDFYKNDPSNHPKLEIEIAGKYPGVYISTDSEGGISNKINIYTINSPVYAKSTTKGFGPNVRGTADLRVEPIVIYDNIPNKIEIKYKKDFIKDAYPDKHKLFINISSMLKKAHNINTLLSVNKEIKKCCELNTINLLFQNFMDKCSSKGTAKDIKNSINEDEINVLYKNKDIKKLLDCIDNMEDKPGNWQANDNIFTAIQICKIMKTYYDSNENDILKKVSEYYNYLETRTLINERLENFNTTGRNITSHEQNKKLVVNFERASSMSNGERDVLSFVLHLIKFEKNFKKNIGILVIDEIFDYLDGSNMLAVQYYLIQTINQCKKKGKVLFPIIFTHLDPEVFSNYYFNKRKIHYISSVGNLSLDSDIVKLLKLRESDELSDEEKEEIEKYYIHYIDEVHYLNVDLANKISENFNCNNIEFRNCLYNEIQNKYLKGCNYDPVMVIAGLRIIIEEKVYNELSENCKADFIKKHTVIKKLHYAEEKGIEMPELFFLLQPLYNAGLHLNGKDENIKRKIKSCYLKTDNMHIKRMIKKIFDGCCLF